MRHRSHLIACVVSCGLLLAGGPLFGEDPDKELSGSVEFLYRTVSQDGSQGKYNEDFDGLSSGLRIGTATLDWTDLNSSFADYARLRLSGLGGDPYESTSLKIGRQDVYDLKFSLRKQDYLYDLFELVDDEDANRWNTERSQTNLDLTLHAHENVDVLVGFREVSRRGDSLFLKDIEREIFQLETPLDQVSKTYTAGVNLRLGPADVIFRQELVNRDLSFENMSEGSLGLDLANPSELNFYDWKQRDTLSSDMTTIKVHTPLGDRLDLNVSVFGSFLGSEDLRSRVKVNADGLDFNGAAFSIMNGFSESDIEMDTLVADLELAVRIIDPLTLILQYRSLNREAEGEAVQDLVGDPNNPAVSMGDVSLDYEVDTLAGILEFQAHRTLLLRVGYQTSDRKLERNGFAGTLGLRDDEFESDGDETVILGAAWKPRSWLRFNADYEDAEKDMPFTPISLVESERLRLRAIINPQSDMSIGATYTDFENNNPVFDSRAEGTSWSLSFSHNASEQISYVLTYAEQDIDTATPIVFDISSFNFAFPGDTQAGDSFFDTDFTQGSAQINWNPATAWRSYLRYSMAESEGENIFIGDTSGVISPGIIDQDYQDVEVGLNYYFGSGLWVGGSFRDFDYDDENDLLNYDGQIFMVRAGLTF